MPSLTHKPPNALLDLIFSHCVIEVPQSMLRDFLEINKPLVELLMRWVIIIFFDVLMIPQFVGLTLIKTRNNFFWYSYSSYGVCGNEIKSESSVRSLTSACTTEKNICA